MGVPRNEAQTGKPGYEGYLNFRVVSMAELLRDAGYQTFMVGKWHLGSDDENLPSARGFDRSFISLDGASHLGGLSWGGPGLAPYVDEGERVTVGDDFYSTQFYTERMRSYIDDGRANGQPFFAYMAYTAPHWPLQAPAESVARFKGRYDEGYDAIYAERLERLKASGLAQPQQLPAPPPANRPGWSDLSADEQRREARYMEIYAAMVSDLDRYIGELVDYLEAIGEMENTVLIFMSDNGPEQRLATSFESWIERCCDNSFDNLGNGNSYVMYGPAWARVSAAPFNRTKSTAFEGGTRVPAFVRYPARVAAGTRDDSFATVVDVLPTLLEIAEHEHPGTRYRDRDVLPLAGRSLWPQFTGAANAVSDEAPAFGWELYGHRAVTEGRWKIVWDQARRDAASWQLFDLATDPGEQTDLAQEQPERLARMLELWDDYARRNGVILAN
jgi:arylsulfatase